MSAIARALVCVTLASTLCQGHSNSGEVVETARNSQANPTLQHSTEDTNFDVASFFNTPVASNLVSLIANAVKSRTIVSNTTSIQQEEEEDFVDGSNSSLVTTTEEDPAPTTSHVLETEDDFLPASADQFGNLGDGSKLVDLLPDMSQYSLDAAGLVPLAGAGAVALVALGAILAVPVAPIILRRTGSNDWSGLPSWKTLFSWWSSPDPTAEAWADKYYQGYGHGHEYSSEAYSAGGEPYYTYDTRGSGSSNTNSYYVDHNNQHSQVVGFPRAEVQEHNPATYQSKEKGHNPVTYQSKEKGHNPATYQSKEKGHNPTTYQTKVHAYHNTNPPNFQNHNPPAYQTHHSRPNRRQGNKKKPTVDGYEYVTLEQINRIGDESVRVLSELVGNYGIDGLYAFRDGTNQIQRRRLLPGRQQHQQQHQQQQQQQQQPQSPYQDNQGHDHTYHETDGHYQTYHDEAPEGHPYRDTISLVEPDGDENDSKDASSEPHPYRQPQHSMAASSSEPHPYRQLQHSMAAASTSEVAGAKKEAEARQVHKVSEFPYEFHKET